MQRGQIVVLPTEVISPLNTPEKKRDETLIAHPQWTYVGPEDTINFEWEIGQWVAGAFDGITERKYLTRVQSASSEPTPFTVALPAISLSRLSPRDEPYICEICFKNKFNDLRVIVENCVRIVEEVAPVVVTKIVSWSYPESAKVGKVIAIPVTVKNYGNQAGLAKVEGELLGQTLTSKPSTFTIGAGEIQKVTMSSFAMPDRDKIVVTLSSFHQEKTAWIKDDTIALEIIREVEVPPEVGEHRLTIEINPVGAGSVTKEPDKTLYNDWELVKLTATPRTGYWFYYWQPWYLDAATGKWIAQETAMGSPIYLYMPTDIKVTANFVRG